VRHRRQDVIEVRLPGQRAVDQLRGQRLIASRQAAGGEAMSQ
jgi:hypothetical protein